MNIGEKNCLQHLLLIFLMMLLFVKGFDLYAAPGADTTGRVGNTFIIDVNHFQLPINNTGATAGFPIPDSSAVWNNTGKLNGELILFSGGFFLSGKKNDSIWMSNVAASSYMLDYLPGAVEDTNNLSKDIFVVRKSDPAFSKSWQDWKDAVKFGAIFYDGDFDGIYNPVDKNLNGIWDPDEDMPFILGDVTAWCVYNDAELPSRRRLYGTAPMGIEIQQSVFATSESHLSNTVFILYSIINRGLVTDILDTVFFSIWADPDIGNYMDDLVGIDTVLQSGYAYNYGPDNELGVDPPAIFFTLLQGPKILDTTSNGFEIQAVNNFGHNYGIYVYEGYKNLTASSFQNWFSTGFPFPPEPTKQTLYNKINGLSEYGLPIDPCNFPFGVVIPDSLCSEVNPYFLYSGDPVTSYGWLNSLYWDQRILLNTGPFKLIKDVPQHIIIAYTGAKGSNAINSVELGREMVQVVIDEYIKNFPSLTYKPGEALFPVTSYILHQNYPNPFNNTTTIRFEIPEDGIVSIRLFDILGREVNTLVNEYKTKNRYEINFDATGLASGVYFYQLQVNDFKKTRKMIYLR